MGERLILSGGEGLRELCLPQDVQGRHMALAGAGALCASQGTLFAASRWGDMIWRIDAELMVPTGLFAGGPGVCRLMTDRAGKRLYALCADADSLLMLDAHSGAPLLLNRTGVGPCDLAMDEAGRMLAVAGGGSGELLLLDALSLRIRRRLSVRGMVFGVALCGDTAYALSLNETMNATLTAFFSSGHSRELALPGLPGALVRTEGAVVAATHEHIFAVAPDLSRVLGVSDAAGRASRLLITRSGVAALDVWSESLVLRERSGRWRPLAAHVQDAVVMPDTAANSGP